VQVPRLIIVAVFCLGMLVVGCDKSDAYSKDSPGIECSLFGCAGSYEGVEFEKGSDVAHQFSNAMSEAVGRKLKELYIQGEFSKVDFSNIEMTTQGMGSGNVVYYLSIPFILVDDKCDAFTSFDHVGGWNHSPALEERKQELEQLVMDGHELAISELKTTKEGLQEYWIQWKNQKTQVDCK